MSTAVKIIQRLVEISNDYNDSFHAIFHDHEVRTKMIDTVEDLIIKLSENNLKLQHQLEIQTKRVENLKKSNEFYAEYNNWTLENNQLYPRIHHLDFEIRDIEYHDEKETEGWGGKLARSCQAIDQELEKELENLK